MKLSKEKYTSVIKALQAAKNELLPIDPHAANKIDNIIVKLFNENN